MDHSDQCNGARANAQLKDIPTHDEACKRVYTRHSAKLYRARFIEKFPSINRYLKDQAENPRKTTMEKFRDSMKTKITAKSEIMKDQNKDYEKNLETALKDIDNLVDWAKERSLYWALELLYWVQNSALLNWFTQYTTGDSTATLSMNVKQLNALFGILENNAVNSKPKCRNFMQAFNEDMRLFQMTSVIPHLVDIEGNAQAFDNLVVQCLDEYMKNYKGSLDQNHIDAVKAAKLLYSEQELRSKLWLPLIDAQRLAAAVGAYSWQLMSKQWELKVYQSAWFKRLTNADKVFQTFQAAVACAIVVAGFLPDYRKQMAPEQKAVWGL